MTPHETAELINDLNTAQAHLVLIMKLARSAMPEAPKNTAIIAICEEALLGKTRTQNDQSMDTLAEHAQKSGNFEHIDGKSLCFAAGPDFIQDGICIFCGENHPPHPILLITRTAALGF